MLRSCYSTSFRFGRGSGQVSLIKWYWCDAGAGVLPFPTPFSSRNYVEKGAWPDLGEVEGAPRPWRNGSFPVDVPGTSGPCGRADVWRFGYPGTVPPIFGRNAVGLLPCCGVPAPLLIAGPGGVRVGGVGVDHPIVAGPGGVRVGGVGVQPTIVVGPGGVRVGGVGVQPTIVVGPGGVEAGGVGVQPTIVVGPVIEMLDGGFDMTMSQVTYQLTTPWLPPPPAAPPPPASVAQVFDMLKGKAEPSNYRPEINLFGEIDSCDTTQSPLNP